jgi:allophanate hydrolase
MESTFVLTRCGDDLFSISVDSPGRAQALAVRLREVGTWLDVVAGIDTVLVRFAAARQAGDDARRAIQTILAENITASQAPAALLEIPVVYGGDYGPDLAELSSTTGLSADELIALHTGREYTVDMIGFTPGFAFIGGLDECFRVPRRKEPRQRVAAGSVGIAGGRTGLYAMASPGGWHIIGRTSYPLFVAAAKNPFALQAGMRVRFRAIGADEFER